MRLFTDADFTFENESVHLCVLDTLVWGYSDLIMFLLTTRGNPSI